MAADPGAGTPGGSSAPATDAPTTSGPSRGRTTWIRLLVTTALVLLAAIPILRSAAPRWRAWYPESDDATILLLSHDTFSAHVPLVGMPSTGGAGLDDPELHHPGAIEMYLLAPLSSLGASPAPGATATVVLLGVASLVGVAEAFRRIGGRALGSAGLVAVGLAMWGLGDDPFGSVWNPYVVVLPFACFLALAVATAAGRRSLLPWTLVLASFVVQTHLSYVGLVGLVTLWVLTVTGWRIALDRSRFHPRSAAYEPAERDARRTRPRLRRTDRRTLIWSAVALSSLWAAPVAQQLTGHPGNLAQILRATTSADGETAGSSALGELGRVVGVPVAGMRPRGDIVRLLPDPSIGDLLLLAAPAVLALALATIARRRSRSDVAWAMATLLVVLLGASLTATRIPLSDGVIYQYYSLWMWPIAAMTWLLLGWGAVVLASADRSRRAGTDPASGRYRPATGTGPGTATGPGTGTATLARGAVAPGVLLSALVLSVVGLLPRPGAWEPWAAYRRIAARTVPDAVDAAPRAGGRYLVRFRGGTPYLSTGSALVAGLDHAGATVLVDPGAPTPVFPWGEHRRPDPDPDPDRRDRRDAALDGTYWVVSGPVSGALATEVPPSAELVASTATLTPAQAARQHERAARLEDLAERYGLRAGPRRPASASERELLDRALADPVAAVRSGLAARLATQGLVEPPGGDLHEVNTSARMQALADEGEVRIYLEPPSPDTGPS